MNNDLTESFVKDFFSREPELHHDMENLLLIFNKHLVAMRKHGVPKDYIETSFHREILNFEWDSPHIRQFLTNEHWGFLSLMIYYLPMKMHL